MRRVSHEEFNFRASEKYHPEQFKEAALNLLDMVNDPESWVDYLKQLRFFSSWLLIGTQLNAYNRTTASNILTAVYGWSRISRKDKPFITRIHAHTARIAGAVVPGAFLVEVFPFMKSFPTWIAKWKRDGLKWHNAETEMFEKLNADVSEKIVGQRFLIHRQFCC